MPPSYLYNAPAGVAGDVSRKGPESNTEPAMLVAVAGVFAQFFGAPMRYVTGGISQWVTGSVAADFAGVLVRRVPEISGNTNQGFDNTIPNPETVQDLLVRGYGMVKCTIGIPARGGIVYIRVVAAGPAAIGDFEATADGGNNVALSTTQATWACDGKDADNNAELRIAR